MIIAHNTALDCSVCTILHFLSSFLLERLWLLAILWFRFYSLIAFMFFHISRPSTDQIEEGNCFSSFWSPFLR